MWSHKRRLLGTTMAVVLGVAFLTASLTIGSTMTAGFDDLFREANAGTDVVVRNATEIGGGDISTRGVDRRVARRRHRRRSTVSSPPKRSSRDRAASSAADGEPIGGDGPPTTADQLARRLAGEPVGARRGSRASATSPPGEPYEVVIDRASAENGDLHVGDQHASCRCPSRSTSSSSGSPRSAASTASARRRSPRSPTRPSTDARRPAGRGVDDPDRRRRRRQPGGAPRRGRGDVAVRRRGDHRRRTDRRDDGRHRGRVPRACSRRSCWRSPSSPSSSPRSASTTRSRS